MVDLVVNTPFGKVLAPDGRQPHGGRERRGRCVTTLPGVFAAVRASKRCSAPDRARSIQEYHAEAMAEPMRGLRSEQAASTTAAGEPPA